MKNILHFSDFHTSDSAIHGMNETRLKTLLSELIDDSQSLPTPDTIFITGDIAYSGQSGEYHVFHTTFLQPLLEHFHLGTDRVLVTPGNHDSNRKSWSKTDELMKKSLMEHPDDASTEAILREKITRTDCEWFSYFESYRRVLDDVSGKNVLLNNRFFSAYEIDNIGVGCINTAWLSFPPDRERILVSEWQLSELLRHLKPFKQKILLHHHPLDWLHPEDRSATTDRVHTSEIKSLFFGHMHSIRMMKESHFSEDSVLKIQAGKMDISKNDGHAGYVLVSLNDENDFDNGELHFRKFDPKKNKFTAWTDRVQNGLLPYSLSRSTPFNGAEFSSLSQRKAENLEYDLLCNVGLPSDQQKRLSEIFIFPSLSLDGRAPTEVQVKPRISKSSSALPPAKKITFDDLLHSDDSLIITGGENSGKSTLAKRITIAHLREQASNNFSHLVFYIDCKNKTLDKERKLREAALSFYTEDSDSISFRSKLEKSLNSSGATVIFDNIESLDKKSFNSIFEYIKSNAKPRYIICGQLSVQQILLELTTKISNTKTFKRYTVKSLKRAHVRELFSKWATTPAKTSAVVNNALRTVTGAGMPNNPFVYTMLLSIRDRKSTAFRSFMHEADLVENFIEIIMHKHVFSTENAPQYKDVLLFLGFLADKMHEAENYCITEARLTKAVVDFNETISQEFSFRGYIDPITTSGIMKKESCGYRFSQICFLNYSYANWICKASIPYEEIDKRIDFLRFDKVIEYVAAIKKSDISLLNYMLNKSTKAWDLLITSEEIDDLKSFESEMTGAVSHDFIDLIKDDKLDSPLITNHKTQEEVDEELDHSSPLNQTAVCDVKSEQNSALAPVVFNETLSLYARVFRAAEHILGADETMRHFKAIFNLYLNSIAYSARVFDTRLRPAALEYILSAIKYESMSENQKKEAHAQINAFINFAIAAVPNLTVSMMSSDFFNQRQKPRIEKHRDGASDNLEKILLTYCLCELDGVDVVKELKTQKYQRPYESSSLLLKVIELIMFNFSITKEEKNELDKFIRKILADRKTNQLFTNLTTISTKVYGHAAQEAPSATLLVPME